MKKKVLLITGVLLGYLSFSQNLPITFPSGNINLNGTLSIPNGTNQSPLIIFVHGSGPNDRDQTTHLTGGNAQCLYPGIYNDTIRNFKDLSNSFVEEGFATLRYDKRTFSHPNLNPIQITPYDFITDIHSAIDYAKTRTEIDLNRIILLGHSQATNFISLVANQRNDIKALISLGAPARSIDTIIAEQYRTLYYYCLNDTSTGDSFYNQTLQDFSQIRNGSWNSSTPYLGAYTTFWNDWFDITDSTIINYNNVIQPSLFLHAMEDFNIPLIDAQIYNSQLTINYNLFYLDNLNHFFTPANNPNVSEVVSDTIIYWLNQNNIISNTFDKPIKESTSRNHFKIIDALGREVNFRKNTPLFYIYKNGIVEKKIVVD